MLYIIVSVPALAVLYLLSYFGEKKGFYGENGENLLFGKVCHFSGGFLVAVFWTAFVSSGTLIIVLTLWVGALWEVYEYFLGIYKFKKYGTAKYITKTADTLEDLFFDTLGAAAWGLILTI